MLYNQIKILLQNNLSADFNVISNVFYDKIGTDFSELSYIITATYNFSDRWSTFFENQTIYQKYKNNTNLGTGLAFLYNKDLQLNTSARFLLEGKAEGFYLGLGLSYRINKHKDAYKEIFKSHDNIQLHFDETVVANGGNIILSNGEDNRTIAIDDTSQVTFNNNMVTINPTTDLVADTVYSFQMESGIITDTAGNAFAGIDEATFTTTADPLLTESYPSDDSTYFEINEDINLYFDEVVVAGSGDIIISNGADTRIIAIDDASQVQFQTMTDAFPAPPAQPTVYSKITINPTEDLIPDTTYSIQIENSAIEDTDGHTYAGIEDVTSLNFTTIEPFPIDPSMPFIL